MSITSVRLKPEVSQPLNDLAKKLDRSKSYIINEAIAEYLAKRNLAEDQWKQTIEAIESIKKGHAVDGNIVNQWLESWGSENELEPPLS